MVCVQAGGDDKTTPTCGDKSACFESILRGDAPLSRLLNVLQAKGLKI